MRKTKIAAVLLFIYILSLLFGNISVLAVSESDYDACDVRISSRIWELLFGKGDVTTEAEGKMTLCVGGDVFGAKIDAKYVSVSDAGKVRGVKNGDIIIKVNGKAVSSIEEIKKAVETSEGRSVTLTLLRDGAQTTVTVEPKLEDGVRKIGLGLRDGAAGIGTITFIDKETGVFGGLGHPICDKDSGEIVNMQGGSVTEVVLGGVKKGASGAPGELTGVLTDKTLGVLYKNCECGIFGRLDVAELEGLEEIEVGKKNEIVEGKAEIISTMKNGKTARFSVEIHDIDTSATGNKCFKIKVTDPALIAISGGIVRGMSGSPVIQNGKLVGAVTHVLVADPTEGYGIFIENMLSAAQTMPKAS